MYDAIEIDDMLIARERRAKRQQELLALYRTTLVSLTLVLPGRYKNSPLIKQAFRVARRVLRTCFETNRIGMVHTQYYCEQTGEEAYFLLQANAAEVKRLTVLLEQEHPLGRLFDMDVIDAEGRLQRRETYGYETRSCIICGEPVWACARQRRHNTNMLENEIRKIIRAYFDSSWSTYVASQTIRALLYEVSIGPKPGLVDRMNSGSHSDMDYYSFLDSISVLQPYFGRMTTLGMTYSASIQELVLELKQEGIRAECRMMEATYGVNTHKGAIFCLGLVCGAVGSLYRDEIDLSVQSIADRVSSFTRLLPYPTESTMPSNSQQINGSKQMSRAFEEAKQAFPSVLNYAYPVLLRELKTGANYEQAGLKALLYLFAHVQDSNIVYRGGEDSLKLLQKTTIDFLAKQPTNDEIKMFCTEDLSWLEQQGLSPGGSADMLALCLVLYFLVDE